MDSKYGSRRKTSSSRGIWLAALLAFVAGGSLVGYSVWYGMGGNGETEADQPQTLASTDPSPDPTGELSPTPTPLAEVIEPETVEEAAEDAATETSASAEDGKAAEGKL